MPKNLTLSIDDELLAKARVLAAMRRTSVNEMVRAFLQRAVQGETDLAARAEAWSRTFQEADNAVHRRERRLKEGEPIFDREATYEEAMRERGLL